MVLPLRLSHVDTICVLILIFFLHRQLDLMPTNTQNKFDTIETSKHLSERDNRRTPTNRFSLSVEVVDEGIDYNKPTHEWRKSIL